MVLEKARNVSYVKPWGVADIDDWSDQPPTEKLTGEIWFERAAPADSGDQLLLKLLFTSQPLSIQVHPGDTDARAMGLARGKSEAWYILGAVPGAAVALGLSEPLDARQLRGAINDGSIQHCVAWQPVLSGDVINVPAGTIHAIGPGLVIAEIQQRSDATFRLHDFERERALHVDDAVRVARADSRPRPARPRRLTSERSLLVSSEHFVLERIDLPAAARGSILADGETWLLVIDGGGKLGMHSLAKGGAVFARAERIETQAAIGGMSMLVAYSGAKGVATELFVPDEHLAVASALDAP
jgi:mannose-6-phosphate isomerase